MFVSYAQNREDVVLWRALGHIPAGTYVDVGAADPTIESVTRVFYDHGWSGINVEPVEVYAEALRRERPRDTTYDVAAGAADGTVMLHTVAETGLSTSRDGHLDAIRARGFEIRDVMVTVRPLTDLIVEAGLGERPLHFLKVDAEGAEAEVLAGLDLTAARPWVLVVEATEPMSTRRAADWEATLFEAGYIRTLFDGLNNFYVAAEHDELVEPLSYPACIFDEPYRTRTNEELVASLDRQRSELTAALSGARSDASRWRSELLRVEAELADSTARLTNAETGLRQLHEENGGLQLHIERLKEHIASMERSVSWRVTGPLRTVRARQLGTHQPVTEADEPTRTAEATDAGADGEERRAAMNARSAEASNADAAFLRRVDAVAALLDPEHERSASIGDALDAFERLADEADVETDAIAWLGHVAAAATYPGPGEYGETARRLRRGGGRALAQRMERVFVEAVAAGGGTGDVEVLTDRVLIDVTHTAEHDLHTGIQRVARECAAAWLQHDDALLVHWSRSGRALRRLSEGEHARVRSWRDHMYEPGTEFGTRTPLEASGAAVVPWNCTLLIPELTDRERSEGCAPLATTSLLRDLSFVGFDLIPVTAAEYVADGMMDHFCRHLSLVKHATRLSAISESAADDFRAFNLALHSQGLSGPAVTATPLPSVCHPVDDDALRATRESFRLGSAPLVLVVGSHEPRKNHLAVLEAAEQLWRDGLDFELLFVGGSKWGRPDFANYLDELARSGRPVQARQRVGEDELWALYQLAAFTVFPSFVEGYGLPIAESLVAGTPAITTEYGSMGEVAAGGGTLTVDPRDPESLRRAMQELLTDRERLAELRTAASERTWPTWKEYADQLWDDLVASSTRTAPHGAA